MPERPHNWDRLKEIVADVLDAPALDRTALLTQLCADDNELLEAARELVDAYDDSTGVIDHRTDAWLGLGGPDVLSLSGERVGRYVLESLIGEGGMAAVYKARQVSTDRTVALKLFRTALPLIDAHNRFRREAQALARLQHPNIAAIYEAGLHDTGDQRALPFIAMEYVDGKPLVEYANAQRLDRHQRIDLIIRVALAVQEAHQQAIIHRDLKPANILVDADGEPKVLDFGIARISGGDSDRVTWQTTAGLLLGTPGYMAPEQCGSDSDVIDVRADVWALGVLLYELLTGRLPIDVSNASITEVLRRISVDEPVLPRTIDPTLRGDLETILMTALSRDKSRRYATAQAFAEDLRRFLTDRPIEARPPTTMYLLTKFATRNKGTIATAVLTTLVILTTTVIAVVGFFKASKERDRAIAAEAQAQVEKQNTGNERDRAVAAETQAKTDRDLALAASQRSESVSRFLIEMLRAPDPNNAGRAVTVLEQIRKALPGIGERFKDAQAAEAEVRAAIGNTLFQLAEYDLARSEMERAVEITTQLEGAAARNTIRMRAVLIEIVRWQNRPQEAKALCDALMADASKVLAADDVDMLPVLGCAAGIESDLENHDAAIKRYQSLVELHRKVNRDHPERLMPVLNNLANAYMMLSRYDEAAKVLNEVTTGIEAADGPDSVSLIIPQFNLGQNLAWAGRYDEAMPIFEKNIRRSLDVYGPDHDHTLIAQRALSDTYRSLGRVSDALELDDEIIAQATKAYGPTHKLVLQGKNSRALALAASGRSGEAIAVFREILATLPQTSLPASMRMSTQRNLASILAETGDTDESIKIYNSIFVEERQLGADGYGSFMTLYGRGQALVLAGKATEAEPDLRAAIEGFARINQPLEAANARRALGRCLTALKRFDASEKELIAAAAVLDAYPDVTMKRKTAQSFVDLYDAWQKPAQATEWRVRLQALSPTTQQSTP